MLKFCARRALTSLNKFNGGSFIFRTGINASNQRHNHTASIHRIISEKEVETYAHLSGDINPIHLQGPRSIVHGTFLLGLVSNVIGTKLPGAGAVVSSLNCKFIRPCEVNSEIKVTVSCPSVRKITTMTFQIEKSENSEVIAQGEAKVIVKT